MTGTRKGITIKKESTSYTFDQRIKSSDQELIRLEIELGGANIHIGSTHTILWNPSNHLTNQTAEKMGLKKVHVEACIKAKQKQKNVPKHINFKSEEAGGKGFFDLSNIEYKSLGGAKFWLLFVNEYTSFKKSYF